MTAGFYKVEPLLVGSETRYIVRDPWGRQVDEKTYETRTAADRVALRLQSINDVGTRRLSTMTDLEI